MSNPLDHDNLYNILGKLAALKPTTQETHDAKVKAIYESVEAQGSILTGVDAVQSKLAKQFAEGIGKDIKRIATGKDVHSRVSQEIAKSQDASMKGDNKTSAKHFNRYDKLDKLANKEQGMEEGMAGMDDAEPYTIGGAVDKQYVYTVMRDGKSMGIYHSLDDAKRIVANNKRTNKYSEFKIARKPRSKMAGPAGKLPEQGVAEARETQKTEKGTIYKGGGYGTEYQGDGDEEEQIARAVKKRGRPAKGTAKPARPKNEPGVKGRPKKAAPISVTAPKGDIFGRTTGKVAKIGTKSVSHKMAAEGQLKARFSSIFEGVNFTEMLKDTDMSVAEMLQELTQDIDSFKKTGQCSDKLEAFLKIHNHGKKSIVADARELPRGPSFASQHGAVAPIPKPGMLSRAGTAIATGAKNAFNAIAPGDEELLRDLKRKSTMEEDSELNELARLAGLSVKESVDPAAFAKLAPPEDEITYADKIAGANKHPGDDMEEGNPFAQKVRAAKADGIQPGETINQDGREYPVKETSFDGAEQSDNVSVTTSFSSADGKKTITINADGAAAEQIAQLLKLSGMMSNDYRADDASASMDMDDCEPEEQEMVIAMEPDMEVADEGSEDLANSPDEDYYSMRASTMGPGEGDAGEKAMHPDRPTKNNGDNALSTPATPPTRAQKTLIAVSTLESRLAAEYESIKKVSR